MPTTDDDDVLFEHIRNIEESPSQLREKEDQLMLLKHMEDMNEGKTRTRVANKDFLEALNDITEGHPFEGIKATLKLLSNIVLRANESFNSDNSEWAKVELSSLGRITDTLQKLIPIFEEQSAKFSRKESTWVEKQIDFNINFIVTNFGRQHVRPYMKALEEFKEELQKKDEIN